MVVDLRQHGYKRETKRQVAWTHNRVRIWGWRGLYEMNIFGVQRTLSVFLTKFSSTPRDTSTLFQNSRHSQIWEQDLHHINQQQGITTRSHGAVSFARTRVCAFCLCSWEIRYSQCAEFDYASPIQFIAWHACASIHNFSTDTVLVKFNHLLIDEVEAINLVQIEHASDADDYWLHVPHPVHIVIQSASGAKVSLLGEARVLVRSSNNPDLLCWWQSLANPPGVHRNKKNEKNVRGTFKQPVIR